MKTFQVGQVGSTFSLYRSAAKDQESMSPIATGSSKKELKENAAQVLSGDELSDAEVQIDRF